MQFLFIYFLNLYANFRYLQGCSMAVHSIQNTNCSSVNRVIVPFLLPCDYEVQKILISNLFLFVFPEVWKKNVFKRKEKPLFLIPFTKSALDIETHFNSKNISPFIFSQHRFPSRSNCILCMSFSRKMLKQRIHVG